MLGDYDNICYRVAAGAAFLDRTSPGWERKVDASILNIESISSCVCGQVFAGLVEDVSGYEVAINRGLINPISAIQFGFNASLVHPAARQAEMSTLAEVWIDLIKERFNSGVLSDS